MSADSVLIELDRISKIFGKDQPNVTALNSISFSVSRGEFVCIVGPSGCGKSTLLRIIAGLIKPTSGAVRFAEEAIGEDANQKTAMVFQDRALFPWMSVLDNVTLGLRAQGWSAGPRNTAAKKMLFEFGLAGFENSKPAELSGGMQQRAALARAFLADPEVLLMDEPFRGLDAQTKLLLQQELLRIWSTDQKTVIYVTHDIDEAIMLGDRIVVMTGRPGQLRTMIPIELSRPRSLLDTERGEVVQIKLQVWKMLEEEALEALRR